jgi:hypothetical protein
MWNSGIFNTGILITRTFLYITEDFWKFEDKAARGKEDDGVDVLAAPAEQHGARRTSAKLKDIAAVISSRLAGESPVSFAFFSAVKARNLRRLFLRGSWRVLWAIASWCSPRQTIAKVEGIGAVNSSRLVGALPVSFALFSAFKAANFAEGPLVVDSRRLTGGWRDKMSGPAAQI